MLNEMQSGMNAYQCCCLTCDNLSAISYDNFVWFKLNGDFNKTFYRTLSNLVDNKICRDL